LNFIYLKKLNLFSEKLKKMKFNINFFLMTILSMIIYSFQLNLKTRSQIEKMFEENEHLKSQLTLANKKIVELNSKLNSKI